MRLRKAVLDDPALRGYSNSPELRLRVFLDADIYTTEFYFGQGDQFNKMAPSNLEAILRGRAGALHNKAVWSVQRMVLKDASLQGDPVELVTFTYFEASKCIVRTGHGALTAWVSDTLTLVNGWSSRANVFNQTGIVPQHVTEVALYDGTDSTEATFVMRACAPVSWVDQQVQYITAGFYRLYEGTEPSDRIRGYWINRSDKKSLDDRYSLRPL